MIPDWHLPTLMNSGQPNPTLLSVCGAALLRAISLYDGRNDDFGDAGAAWAAAQLAWDKARCFCLWAITAIKEFAYVCKASQMQPHLKSIGKSYSDKGIKAKPHTRNEDHDILRGCFCFIKQTYVFSRIKKHLHSYLILKSILLKKAAQSLGDLINTRFVIPSTNSSQGHHQLLSDACAKSVYVDYVRL